MVAEGACRQDPGPALGCAAPTQLAGRAPGRADGRGQRPSGPGRFGSSEALEGAAGARAPPLAPGASPGCPQDAGRQEPVGTRQRCDVGRPCPREPSASFLRRSDSDSIPEARVPPAAAPRTGSVGVPGPAVTLGHSGSPEARCGGQRREPRGQPGCGSASRSQSLWTCPDPRVSGGVRDLMDSSWLQAAAVFTRWTQGSSPCPAGAGRGGAGLGGKVTCSQASSVEGLFSQDKCTFVLTGVCVFYSLKCLCGLRKGQSLGQASCVEVSFACLLAFRTCTMCKFPGQIVELESKLRHHHFWSARSVPLCQGSNWCLRKDKLVH